MEWPLRSWDHWPAVGFDSESEDGCVDNAFMPDVLNALITQASSNEDVELIEDDLAWAIHGKLLHVDEKGSVTTCVAFTNTHKAYFMQAVKKELQVLRDQNGKLTDAEVQGVFCVQMKLQELSVMI